MSCSELRLCITINACWLWPGDATRRYASQLLAAHKSDAYFSALAHFYARRRNPAEIFRGRRSPTLNYAKQEAGVPAALEGFAQVFAAPFRNHPLL